MTRLSQMSSGFKTRSLARRDTQRRMETPSGVGYGAQAVEINRRGAAFQAGSGTDC